MASIRKKNGKWQVQIRRKGFAPLSRTFLKKSDATDWARAMEVKADRRDLPADMTILDCTKLSDLVNRYRDEIAAKKKCAAIEIVILNAFLRHKICKRSLSAISISDWSKYRDERLRTITAKSLKRELSPISHMFRVAHENWNLPVFENPFYKLKINSVDRRRERRLDHCEQTKLLSYASQTSAGYLAHVVTLALETGMRRGELLKIKVEHVDFGRRLLSIPETKNGEPRTIPLTQTALQVLRERLRCEKDGRLFKVTENGLRLSWDRVCKKANIDNLHFHDLRHEAISRFFELGLTTPEVALISGHKDVRMLFRYAHATQKSILGKFGNLPLP